MPDIDVELITTREASNLLSESVRQTIRRVERDELVPVKKLDGVRGSYIFNRADIDALLTPTTSAESSPQASAEASFSGGAA